MASPASRQDSAPANSVPVPDPSAWLDRHGDAMFRYAVRRVRNSAVAEELVQEALLAGLRAFDGFAQRSTERTWLIGILRRKIVDHIRTSVRQEAGEAVELADRLRSDLFDSHGVWKSRVANWPDQPATDLEREEFWAVFDDCMSKLPRSLADAFALREMEGLVAEEICKILAITPSNLWTTLHRARTLLRQCLDLNWFNRSP